MHTLVLQVKEGRQTVPVAEGEAPLYLTLLSNAQRISAEHPKGHFCHCAYPAVPCKAIMEAIQLFPPFNKLCLSEVTGVMYLEYSFCVISVISRN